jgi:hypothetical protein
MRALMNFFNDLWSDFLLDSTLLYWMLLPIALVLAAVAWLIRDAPNSTRVAAVAVVAIVALGSVATVAVLNADAESEVASDDLYRTPGGLVERDDYDPTELWNSMTPGQRSQACGTFRQGRVATLRMLSEAGYPEEDSRAVVDLLDDECGSPAAATTTTTTVSPQRRAEANRQIDEALAAFTSLTEAQRSQLCEQVWARGGPEAWSTWLYESGAAPSEEAGALGVAAFNFC